MRLVIALGGNALLRRFERPDAGLQRHHVRLAAEQLAPVIAEHELIICHGNGPQIGMLALESEADADLSVPFPLDPLGAQTQGMIGYWLLQGLPNALPGRQVAAASLRREDFAPGSMGPKVDAVCRFVEVTGDMAAIGALEDAAMILEGKAGTVVTPAGDFGRPGDLGPGALRPPPPKRGWT
jgi:carbamate kinase